MEFSLQPKSSDQKFEKIPDGTGKIVAFIYNGKRYALDASYLAGSRKNRKGKMTKRPKIIDLNHIKIKVKKVKDVKVRVRNNVYVPHNVSRNFSSSIHTKYLSDCRANDGL